MKFFGLIGYPLSHSFSRDYFIKKFLEEQISDTDYQLFPIENISLLPEIIKNNPALLGLNVTIPYKEQVTKYINVLDEATKQISAVNVIKIIREKSDAYKLIGYNTDTYGFSETIKPLLKAYHKKALILGTGGASKAVGFVLQNLGIKFTFVSRNPQNINQISYNAINKDIIASHLIIINATPAGTYPAINDYPDIPYAFITEKHLLIDLIYNPDETVFLRKGKERGAVTKNGFRMLQLQAEKSWQIWNS